MATFENLRQRGNIAMLFALTLIGIGTAAGVALDFFRAFDERTRAQEAADAAMLAGVRRASAALNEGRGAGAAKAEGEAFAMRVFTSQFGSSAGFTPVVTLAGGDISGEGSYVGTIPTTLLSIMGREAIPVMIGSTIRYSATSFLDIHIVIDNSNSLGIGATPADIQTMANSFSCAFACHAPDFDTSGRWNSLDDARAIGAVLRIDVIRDAVRQFIAGIENSQNPNVRIALHTISNEHTRLHDVTNDFNSLRTSLDGVDLENNPGNGGTSFANSLNEFSRTLQANGDGSSQNRARNLVILVTDGVETNAQFRARAPANPDTDDIWEADPDFVAYAPTILGTNEASLFNSQGFNPAICDAIKEDKGAEFATMNIEYRIPTVGTDNDPRFSQIESVLIDRIDDNLADCASARDLHFRIRDDSQIAGSFDQLLNNLTQRFLRITR